MTARNAAIVGLGSAVLALTVAAGASPFVPRRALVASEAAATPSVIRVGGPSAPDDAKIAIVASDADLASAAFRVTAGGQTVLTGQLRAAAGSAAPWKHAFEADLSSVRRPGSYRIHAGGVTSRPWRVAPNGSSSLIPLVLRFFRA